MPFNWHVALGRVTTRFSFGEGHMQLTVVQSLDFMPVRDSGIPGAGFSQSEQLIRAIWIVEQVESIDGRSTPAKPHYAKVSIV
jgi:hypothetical protein